MKKPRAGKITEAMRRKMAWELVEEISTHAQSTDPQRDWKDSHDAICNVYRIAHAIRLIGCRKNHPKWCDAIDAAIRAKRKEGA